MQAGACSTPGGAQLVARNNITHGLGSSDAGAGGIDPVRGRQLVRPRLGEIAGGGLLRPEEGHLGKADATKFGLEFRRLEPGLERFAQFGDAFFQQGLAKGNSFETAFEIAKSRVAERERAAGYAPSSEPQWSLGSEMKDKLKTLRKRGAAGATVSNVAPSLARNEGIGLAPN